MTETELLKKTGNHWSVSCYRGGNRRKLIRYFHVRAHDKVAAEQIAMRQVPGCNSARASAYDPRRDYYFGSYVQYEDFETDAGVRNAGKA